MVIVAGEAETFPKLVEQVRLTYCFLVAISSVHHLDT